MSSDLSPEALLPRPRIAEELTLRGFRVKPSTLATMAVRGGGPPFRKFGRAVVYHWGDALAWAEGRLSAPARSTAEADLNSARQST
ncbi:MAG TPA: DNA-binding protein [Acidisoma sp.]|jgi:hypothetical protein|uniref:DNA-binding protein n=1 Tax=Acidisoma sp. TaxID=1872115 RepID=UPI002C916B09|nr:DNA-binding protein [Acidisoma sp.]HTH99554.1 DNA-binding protein [Acidisoma sp.]